MSGIAYGLAIDICCACDIRYATEDVQFSIRVSWLHVDFGLVTLTLDILQEVDIGIAADMGTLSRLGKIIGNDSLARELAFTARPFGVDEAVRMGFVSRVVKGGHNDVVDTALAVARVIGCEFLFRPHNKAVQSLPKAISDVYI